VADDVADNICRNLHEPALVRHALDVTLGDLRVAVRPCVASQRAGAREAARRRGGDLNRRAIQQERAVREHGPSPRA
jgi:hypothetical protein